jgi:hypothetical protein
MKIVPFNDKSSEFFEKRFAIADDNGKIVDDAQGYGYKTAQKAHKAMWYKFGGGKQKIQSKKDKKRSFLKQHPGLEKFIDNITEDNFKEIARGEVTDQDILDEIKEKFGVEMPKEYLYCD